MSNNLERKDDNILKKADSLTLEKEITFGSEFVDWAEEFWGLNIMYDSSQTVNSESCPYDYVRNAFINKINEMLKNKLNLNEC